MNVCTKFHSNTSNSGCEISPKTTLMVPLGSPSSRYHEWRSIPPEVVEIFQPRPKQWTMWLTWLKMQDYCFLFYVGESFEWAFRPSQDIHLSTVAPHGYENLSVLQAPYSMTHYAIHSTAALRPLLFNQLEWIRFNLRKLCHRGTSYNKLTILLKSDIQWEPRMVLYVNVSHVYMGCTNSNYQFIVNEMISLCCHFCWNIT